MSFGPWDFVLVAVVSLQATVLALMYQPRWKAFILTLPLPFTFATLALGQAIDATSLLAMWLVLAYTHSVRLLHTGLRVPIVAAIALSALGYCGVGWIVARFVPSGDLAFYATAGATLALATVVLKLQPHRDEPGHRTSLPVWIKLPIIVAVVLCLVLIKNQLRGFMAMFPMVGVIAAYEARHSLWTMCRQIPVVMFTMTAMMVVSRLTVEQVGLGASLALGWVAFLAVFWPMTRAMWNERE